MEENQQVPPSSEIPSPALQNSQPPVAGDVPTEATPSSKKLIMGLVVLVVLILGGGGYYAYASYFAPLKVWQKYISHPTVTSSYSEAFNFSYQDNGKFTGAAASYPMSQIFNNLKMAMEGTAYANVADPAKPKAFMDFSYTFGAGDTSISSKAHLIMLNGDTYINPGNNPMVNSAMAFLSPTEKIEWIKFSPAEFQDAAAALNPSTTPGTKLDFTKQVKEYQDIFEKYLPKIVLMDKVLGRETVRGVATIHFSNKVDKVALKAMLGELFGKIMDQASAQAQSKPEELAQAKTFFTKFTDVLMEKTKASVVETWVGVTDAQIHKLKIVSNAPSIISIASAGMNDSNSSLNPEKSMDAALSGMTFDGQFSMDEEIYDYGKVMEVKAPDKSIDLAKKLKEQMQNMMPATGTNAVLK